MFNSGDWIEGFALGRMTAGGDDEDGPVKFKGKADGIAAIVIGLAFAAAAISFAIWWPKMFGWAFFTLDWVMYWIVILVLAFASGLFLILGISHLRKLKRKDKRRKEQDRGKA